MTEVELNEMGLNAENHYGKVGIDCFPDRHGYVVLYDNCSGYMEWFTTEKPTREQAIQAAYKTHFAPEPNNLLLEVHTGKVSLIGEDEWIQPAIDPKTGERWVNL